MGVIVVFPSLHITLTAVACAQFIKLKEAILDIREKRISPHYGQEDDQVRTTANCNLQDKLNACIRHHQEIME